MDAITRRLNWNVSQINSIKVVSREAWASKKNGQVVRENLEDQMIWIGDPQTGMDIEMKLIEKFIGMNVWCKKKKQKKLIIWVNCVLNKKNEIFRWFIVYCYHKLITVSLFKLAYLVK